MIQEKTPDPNLLAQLIKQKYIGLKKGLRDREDPVTWRTLAVDLRFIRGSVFDPEHEPPAYETFETGSQLVDGLIEGTYLKPLKHEIMWSIYGEYGEDAVLPPKETVTPLDVLIINSRHKTQSILGSLADHLSSLKYEVAAINPTGHYNDKQTRMLAPDLLVRPVNTAIFLTSTQEQDGGNLEVLNYAIRILRNPNFAYMIDRVVVVIPMFGGSRGHRLGQSKVIGYEVSEPIYATKLLTNTFDDMMRSIIEHDKYPIYQHVKSMRPDLKFPPVIFVSIDIHNNVLPARKFFEAKYPFISASPAKEQAEETIEILTEKGLRELPIRVIACDEGSVPRTDQYVMEFLKIRGEMVEIIYIDKLRISAGEVENCDIQGVVSCQLDAGGELKKEPMVITESDAAKPCVCIYVDDMIDTGTTAKTDIELVRSRLAGIKYMVFITSHPIFSKGVKEAIDKIGADMYLLGNSLNTQRFQDEKRIQVVDLAPSIARAIGF